MLDKLKKRLIELHESLKKEIEEMGGLHIFIITLVVVLIIWPFILLYYFILRPTIKFVRMLFDLKEFGLGTAYRKNFHSERYEKEERDRDYKKKVALKEPLLPPSLHKKFNDMEDWPDAYVVDNIAVYGAEGRTLLFVDENAVEFDVPEGVENIYHYCFAYCGKLERVSLPESLKRIGKRTFFSCVSLKEVTVPKSVSIIGKEMFLDCSSLEHVELPDQLTDIPIRMFANCRNLREFKLPSNVRVIETEAFKRCYKMEHIETNKHLEIIKEKAFEDCYSLKEFIMPETIRYCTKGMFDGCHSLQHIHFSPLIKDFGGSCCRDCWSITKISMPEDKETKSYAKKQWEKYSDKIDISTSESPIPESMFWTMGDSLYFGIPRLTSVCLVFCFSKNTEYTIPSFVTNVKRDAFTSCKDLCTLRLSPFIKASDDPWESNLITHDFIYDYWPQVENVIFDESLKNTEYAFGLIA